MPLMPFSKKLVKDVFMVIEEPEKPLAIPTVRPFADELEPPRTIGQFYGRIRQKILAIGATAFTGNPARQVTSDEFSISEADQRVTDPTSATKAIDYIVHQGEGTTDSPKFDGTGVRPLLSF